MDTRNIFNGLTQAKLQEQAGVIAEGTAIGVIGRFITWPGEKLYHDKYYFGASYPQIIRDIFTFKNLLPLQGNFFKTGLLQTIGKSATNMGVISVVEHNYRDESPLKKGLRITALSVPLETLATSRGEWYKINNYRGQCMSNKTIFSPCFVRVLGGTFIRLSATSLFTFSSIYQTASFLETQFPKTDPSTLKPLAAGLASFAVQAINIPFINFQTSVLADSEKPLKQVAKDFFKEPQKIFAGFVGRGIHRSCYYGLTFFISEQVTKNRDQTKEFWIDRPKLK